MKLMIKKVVSILLVVLFLINIEASANSGPTYWQGYPSAEILAIDENCPLEVKSEKLIFDFSGKNKNSYAPRGNVTASYELVNPTERDLTVQMAFPLISSLQDYKDDEPSITVDQQALSYELYLAERMDKLGSASWQDEEWQLDFAQILKSISKQAYRGKHFSLTESGKLYIFKVKPMAKQGINLALDFQLDPTKSRIVAKGFNSYQREGQKVRVAASCYEPEVLEIFVLGEDVDFQLAGYSDGELREKTDQYACEKLSREESLKSYLTKYIEERSISLPKAEENQLINLFASRLDDSFADYEGFATTEDLEAAYYAERVFTLVFTAEFPAQTSRKLSVSYQTTGTMDKTRTVYPTYTYSYLLNPAQNWADFGELAIELRTPEEAPFIIESNIDFKQEGERVYTAKLTSLPDSDLYFTLYEKEKITLLDRAYKLLNRNGALLLRFCFLLALIAACYFGAKRKKGAKKFSHGQILVHG